MASYFSLFFYETEKEWMDTEDDRWLAKTD